MVYVTSFKIEREHGAFLLRLHSGDGTNRLARSVVDTLSAAIRDLASEKLPIVITGNDRFFSAGADLNEIAELNGPSAYEFSKAGQELMQRIQDFPARVVAAISGYCMGGGLDLALACTSRIASPPAIFGHRGASLGLITVMEMLMAANLSTVLLRALEQGPTEQRLTHLESILGKGKGLAAGVVSEKL